MTSVLVEPADKIAGLVSVPGDKSISHRAAILAAMADGPSHLQGFLESADCLATLQALRDLGVRIEPGEKGCYTVHGNGPEALKNPSRPLDLGNSGTGMRLLAGLIVGQPIKATLTGDDSLRARPMSRVIEPLARMGAKIVARDGKHAPLELVGGHLKGISYTMNVASAQVKSAILLAALQAQGPTKITEPFASRDHTERLVRHLGGKISVSDNQIQLVGPQRLKAKNVTVPGDLSSAAFLIAAALLLPGSQLVVQNVCLNPTRTGFLDVLKKMGARVKIKMNAQGGCEPVGSITAQHTPLKGVKLDDPMLIPNIIDEIPILCVLAARAKGITEIRHAQELRVKETDRIAAMTDNLRAQGVRVEDFPDGLRIHGEAKKFPGGNIDARKDHRIAMAFAVAGLCAERAMRISDAEFVDTSFPGFFELLKSLSK